jgi:5-methylcytosine-specific restriction endonuclease McrA
MMTTNDPGYIGVITEDVKSLLMSGIREKWYRGEIDLQEFIDQIVSEKFRPSSPGFITGYLYLSALTKERYDELKSMDYAEYLISPEWKAKADYLKFIYGKCQLCGKGSTSLHVHHNTYKDRPQEYHQDLIVLCPTCHQRFHDNVK